MYLFLVPMFISLTFRNFERRLSLQSIRCLTTFVSGLWRSLSATFRKSSSSVLCVLCDIISLVLLIFLCALVLSLCLLTLLLVLCLKTLLASLFVMSFLVLPLPLLSPLVWVAPPLLPLVLLWLLGLIAFVGSQLRGHLCGMPLFPLSLRRLLGHLLLYLPPPISLMSSFLPRKVLVWALWWRRVPWFRCL